MLIKYEEFLPKASSEQKKIIGKIVNTFNREASLLRIIRLAADAVKSGRGVFSEDGFGITLCENKNDFYAVTAGPRSKLIASKYQMCRYLEEAVDAGMEDLDIVEKNFERYVEKSISEYKKDPVL
tara:strand:- start:769 stop:1143 length:375 start_codon:yes stop_codon:yes gene_type:complete